MQYQTFQRRRFRRLAPVLLALAGGGSVLGWSRSVSPAPEAVELRPAAAVEPLARSSARDYVWMEVTAYCPCKICCGRRAKGITASGKSVRHNGGRFVAADTDVLPFHTKVSIPGYHDGEPVPVIDTGSAIVGHRLDVFFPSHQTAEQWGRKMLRVRISSR